MSLYDDTLTFNTYDYAIGGKMVVGKAIMSEEHVAMIKGNDDDAKMAVKRDLINQLTKHMLENNLVEFTSHQDHVTGNTMVAVRAYLAPDDKIRILRVANKI
jgi:hypothetical protein